MLTGSAAHTHLKTYNIRLTRRGIVFSFQYQLVRLNGYICRVNKKLMKYNLIIESAEESGFIGYVFKIPGANIQGETEEEIRQNSVEAIQLIQEVRK